MTIAFDNMTGREYYKRVAKTTHTHIHIRTYTYIEEVKLWKK